jgi:hypothetical protein
MGSKATTVYYPPVYEYPQPPKPDPVLHIPKRLPNNVVAELKELFSKDSLLVVKKHMHVIDSLNAEIKKAADVPSSK